MNRMREIRRERGLTMKELGKLVGMGESTISLYETGKHDPDIDTLNRIADALSVTVDELLGRPVQTDDDIWELRDRLRSDPDMRVLFDAATKAKPEHLKAAAAMLKALEPSTFPEDAPQEFPDEMP